MRYTLLLFTLTLVCSANGQDFCNRIKTEISPDKMMHDYSSPYDPLKIPAVLVTRKYSTDPEAAFDNFTVTFQIAGALDDIYNKTPDGGQTEKEEKSLVVEFEDKSKIVEEAVPVSHNISDDRTQAIRLVYYPLTDANVTDLASKKIVKFSLAGHEQVVRPDSANAIQHYVQCMKAMK